MSYSSVSFKKTLGFSSLTLLASLIYSPQGVAMLSNQDIQKQELENFQFIEHKPLTLDFFNELILKAKEGDIQAQDELMKIYYRGLYRTFLTPEIIDFFSWRNQGTADDIENLCYKDDFYASFVIYHFKNIGEQFPKLLITINERANLGHANAQVNLAFMYNDGLGVDKDEKEACRYYKLAADKGHAHAQNNLGCMYVDGIGVNKNEKEAYNYYKLAADQGYVRAQYNLGIMYKYGRGVDKDEKEASWYYKLAANQGDADAQYNLAYMYEKGRGVDKDNKEAFRYYKLAADQGKANAQVKLATMYQDGSGVKKNLIEVLHWCIKSKRQGTEAFIRYYLPLSPNIPVKGDPFEKMLINIMKGNNQNINAEMGFARLMKSHQAKIATNCVENKLAIPKLADMYTFCELLEVETMNMLELLAKNKPGFMVTAVSLSREMENELPYQITPFFSLDEVDGISYLTIGEENVRMVNKFVTFLKESDEKFAQADKKLEEVARLYNKILDSVLSALMVKQQLARIFNNDEDSIEGFEEQKKKYNELKLFLIPIFKENEEERTLLRDLHKQIKSLPVRGAGSRNKDFLEEYP